MRIFAVLFSCSKQSLSVAEMLLNVAKTSTGTSCCLKKSMHLLRRSKLSAVLIDSETHFKPFVASARLSVLTAAWQGGALLKRGMSARDLRALPPEIKCMLEWQECQGPLWVRH